MPWVVFNIQNSMLLITLMLKKKTPIAIFIGTEKSIDKTTPICDLEKGTFTKPLTERA